MGLAELNTKDKADEGFEVEILHPKTHTPIGVYIKILGTDSETYRRVTRKNQNRRLEIAKRGRMNIQTAEEIEFETVNILAECTVSWRTDNDPRLELEPGKMFDCTLENARKLYSDPGFTWLKDQINQEGGDRSNFL